MLNEELLERYKTMEAEEKLAALNHILDMDVPPIDMVIGFYWMLRPCRVGAMAQKLKESLANYRPASPSTP